MEGLAKRQKLFADALTTADPKYVASFYTSNCFKMVPGKDVMLLRDDVLKYYLELFNDVALIPSVTSLELKELSVNFGFDRGEFILRDTEKKPPIDTKAKYLALWTMIDHVWYIYSDCFNV